MKTTLDEKPTGEARRPGLLLSDRASRWIRFSGWLGHGLLLAVSSSSAFAVLFLFYFILKDALPFFWERGVTEFFFDTRYYPTADPPTFGAFPIFYGSFMVTIGAIALAVPLGISAAVCLSDVLPFAFRQWVKPMIEILAAIPSVAYGFFALVVLAPLLQDHGGRVLAATVWIIGAPLGLLVVFVVSDLLTGGISDDKRRFARWLAAVLLGIGVIGGLLLTGRHFGAMSIASGTNALNVSMILGIMALPTVVSVSEDALQAVGRELREGSYALGATRAETIVQVVLPAASGGICAAVILGIMRAVGETMVVWMASGNAAQVPVPMYNYLEPIRTLTATIAGDMGEADQVTGSARYHVLFAMAASLLSISFLCNLVSEWFVARATRRSRGE